jgi:hypothetical protein
MVSSWPLPTKSEYGCEVLSPPDFHFAYGEAESVGKAMGDRDTVGIGFICLTSINEFMTQINRDSGSGKRCGRE